MYLGRYSLGQYVPLAVLTLGDGYSSGWPSVAPNFAVYDDSGERIVTGSLPSVDRELGTFSFRLRLGTAFAVGHHTAVVDWILDGTNRRAVSRFEVVGGGNANGGIISMHAYRRPHADFLVSKLDTFQRAIQRNPG